MKLGVLTVLLGDLSLDETLRYLKSLGVQQVEIGCGGTPGTAHADAIKFLEHPELIDAFLETIQNTGWTSRLWPATAIRSTPTGRSPTPITGNLRRRFCWRRKSVSTRSSASPAARATARPPSIPIGPSPAGRRTSPKSGSGSGMKSSFPIGRERPGSPWSTAWSTSRWSSIRASASTTPLRFSGCGRRWAR